MRDARRSIVRPRDARVARAGLARIGGIVVQGELSRSASRWHPGAAAASGRGNVMFEARITQLRLERSQHVSGLLEAVRLVRFPQVAIV